MTEKELKKLSRTDLLEMLIDQSSELQALRERCAAAEEALNKRNMDLNQAGSIAEAALRINGVFEAAQAAAEDYLENIRELSERQESVVSQMERESQEKAGQLLIQAEMRCKKMEADTKIQCAEMQAKAKAEAQVYWDEVKEKLDAYYEQHTGLFELLSILAPKQK